MTLSCKPLRIKLSFSHPLGQDQEFTAQARGLSSKLCIGLESREGAAKETDKREAV